MLNHPTLDQLKEMKLSGLAHDCVDAEGRAKQEARAEAFEEQLLRADYNDLTFDDRLAH